MAVDTYYFDTSDGGPTDTDGVFTNDANAFDGNTGTSSTTGGQGSTSSNFLMGEGTDAPSAGLTITQVRARIYGGSPVSEIPMTATIFSDALAESLGVVVSSTTGGYGSYTTLSTPTGGWTWAGLQALEVKIYKNTASAGSTTVSRVEIEVTSDASGTPAASPFNYIIGR